MRIFLMGLHKDRGEGERKKACSLLYLIEERSLRGALFNWDTCSWWRNERGNKLFEYIRGGRDFD